MYASLIVITGFGIVFFLAFIFRRFGQSVGLWKKEFVRWMGLFFLAASALLWYLMDHVYSLPATTTPEQIRLSLLNDLLYPEYLLKMQAYKNVLEPFFELTFVVGLALFLISFTRDAHNTTPTKLDK